MGNDTKHTVHLHSSYNNFQCMPHTYRMGEQSAPEPDYDMDYSDTEHQSMRDEYAHMCLICMTVTGFFGLLVGLLAGLYVGEVVL